jgi:hypothetical protein
MSAAGGAKVASAKKVANAVAATTPVASGLRTGVVTGVNSGSQLVASVSGSSLVLPYLDSYNPQPGDNVQILKSEDTWVCIGAVGNDGSGSRVIDGVVVTTSATIAGPSTTEVNVPNVELSGFFFSSKQYIIFFQILTSLSTNTEQYSISVRLNTAVTGTLIGLVRETGAGVPLFAIPWSPATSGTYTIFFGIAIATGSGTVSAFGSPGGNTARTWSAIQEVGSDAAWRIS